MIDPGQERRLLQIAIAAGSLVPLLAGGLGILSGAAMTGLDPAPIDLDSHVRYLSGLLLAIGLAFVASIPAVERHGRRIRLLTAIVFAGGLARLYGVLLDAAPGAPMLFGLAMELMVTPALCLWQARIARRY